MVDDRDALVVRLELARLHVDADELLEVLELLGCDFSHLDIEQLRHAAILGPRDDIKRDDGGFFSGTMQDLPNAERARQRIRIRIRVNQDWQDLSAVGEFTKRTNALQRIE